MFTRRLRLHPDRKVSALLGKWGVRYTQETAVVCRRLFSDMDDMQRFFDLAFPHLPPLSESDAEGMLGRGQHSDRTLVDIRLALNLLNFLGIERHQFYAAAFLVNEAHRSPQTDWARDGQSLMFRDCADAFTEAFVGVHPTVLQRALRYADWRQVAACRWILDVLDLGVPDAYVQELVIRPLMHGKAWNPWTPQQIAGFHAEGMTLEYLIQFYKRPRVLTEMWEHRLPLDYAIALDESTRTD